MTCLLLWSVSGCVSDHTVEADVQANRGIVQPGEGGGTKLAAADACGRIKSARTAAATKLGCDDPGDVCPNYLLVAGSVPCAEYAEGSVDACVAVIERYKSCNDLSAKACVVTPVSASCAKPAAPDAGGEPRDSGGTPKEAAPEGGGGRDSAGGRGEGGTRDGSTDAGAPDG